jgi:ferredoxin
MCYLLAPDLFEVDDEGRGAVLRARVGTGDEEKQALMAVDRCPERAIRLWSA